MSKKKILCSRCNSEVNMLMDENHQIICPNCSKIKFINKKDLKKSKIFKDVQSLIYQFNNELKKIKYPGELFLTVLDQQNSLSGEILDYPDMYLGLNDRWILLEYMLERMIAVNLDLSLTHPTPPSKRKPIDFNYLLPIAEEALKVQRSINDLEKGEIVYGYNSQKQLERFITDRKIFHISTKIVIDFLIETFPLKNNFYSLNLFGFNPYHFLEGDEENRYYNTSIKIFSDFSKQSSFNIIDEKLIPNLRYLDLFGQLIMDYIDDNGRLIEPLTKNVIRTHKNAIPLLKQTFQTFLIGMPNKYQITKFTNLEKFFIQSKTYFMDQKELHTLFFETGDYYVTSKLNLKLYWYMLLVLFDLSYPDKCVLRQYRCLKFEKDTWRLGFHLDVDCFFPDNTPMINIFRTNGNNNECADVLFHKNNELEIIQCKADMALPIKLQHKYYTKFLQDEKFVLEECKKKGLNVKKNNLVMFSRICIMIPPDEIKVFTHDFHLFEYLIGKYSLYQWSGESYFENHPILAKIAWLNYDKLNSELFDLSLFLDTDNLFLLIANFKDKKVHFNLKDKKFESVIPKLTENENVEWDELKVIIIWNNLKNTIEDYLFIPPYWRNSKLSTNEMVNAFYFHSTNEGMKFLYIGILNGIFGYCENCIQAPLIPRGYPSKPYRISAKGICPICHGEYSLLYDGYMFGENKELIDTLTKELIKRFSF